MMADVALISGVEAKAFALKVEFPRQVNMAVFSEFRGRRLIRFPADYFGLAIFGHQWKPALPLMASRWLARAAHLFPMMSSSSSIVAMCLLTMGSSTSAHNVSAGCSSGV